MKRLMSLLSDENVEMYIDQYVYHGEFYIRIMFCKDSFHQIFTINKKDLIADTDKGIESLVLTFFDAFIHDYKKRERNAKNT